MARIETIGDATLYLGDCLEIMASFPPCFRVDSVITDPPYGVDFGGKKTKATARGDGYATYKDTKANLLSVVVPAISAARAMSKRVAVMTANSRIHEMPKPSDIGGIFAPAGAGLSSWGFTCFHPVLFYGVSPYLEKGMGSRPTGVVISHPGGHITGELKIDHPCPKPVEFMLWLVQTASLPRDTVCDPFMGSGTTGVACAKLGRKFIGIELEPKYFDIACKRIDDAYRQPRLFSEPAPKPKQIDLLK